MEPPAPVLGPCVSGLSRYLTIKHSVQLLNGSSQGGWSPTVLQKVWCRRPARTLGLFNRNYAAGLTTAAQKWFWGPLRPGKIPKVSVLEAEFSYQIYDSINFAGKIVLPLFFAHHALRTRYLIVAGFKNSRPALIGNGEPVERRLPTYGISQKSGWKNVIVDPGESAVQVFPPGSPNLDCNSLRYPFAQDLYIFCSLNGDSHLMLEVLLEIAVN